MANIKSAKKRILVINKKTARNRRIKSHLKGILKNFDVALKDNNLDAAAEKLILFLQGIKYIKKNREIDVRAKFIFLENNTPVIICTDGFEIQVNGRLIKRNEKFTNFLKNLIRGD